MNFKWLTVPFSNATTKVQAVRMWEVRWESRNGTYSFSLKPELECFDNELEARGFERSLLNAFALLRITGEGCRVSISQARDR